MGIRVLRARGRCVDSGEAGPGLQVGDADFEGVVLDKAHDTFVLFYRPHPLFCASNGTAYAAYDVPQPSVKVCRRCVQGQGSLGGVAAAAGGDSAAGLLPPPQVGRGARHRVAIPMKK